MPLARIALTLTFAGGGALAVWSCSPGSGRRDQYYGTDVGVGYEPPDGSIVPDGDAPLPEGGASERPGDGTPD